MLKNSSSRNHMDNQCQECGCNCDNCVDNNYVHLHQEIESLKERLKERDEQILAIESQILSHANQFPNGETQALRDNLFHWQDKYQRLLENYRKLQKVNQGLEDKLLRAADRFESEKIVLTQNVNDLTNKLNETETTLQMHKKESESYKNDYDLVIKMIQNQSPSSIINIESLPNDFQVRMNEYLEDKRKTQENRNTNEPVRVPIPTFPPTAILYSLDQQQQTKKFDKPNESSKSIHHKFVFSQLLAKEKANTCPNCNEKIYHSPELLHISNDYNNQSNNQQQSLMASRTTAKNYNNKTILNI